MAHPVKVEVEDALAQAVRRAVEDGGVSPGDPMSDELAVWLRSDEEGRAELRRLWEEGLASESEGLLDVEDVFDQVLARINATK